MKRTMVLLIFQHTSFLLFTQQNTQYRRDFTYLYCCKKVEKIPREQFEDRRRNRRSKPWQKEKISTYKSKTLAESNKNQLNKNVTDIEK